VLSAVALVDVHIGQGAQFTSGYVEMNPNSKIPAAMHHVEGRPPVRLFESASIMLYLAELHDAFLPSRVDVHARAEMYNWLFWQMSGQGPMTGNYGHFMVYAPESKVETRSYGVARYGMEVQRCCSVLENHLAAMNAKAGCALALGESPYLVNNEYGIADMACFPWVNQLLVGYNHQSVESSGAVQTTSTVSFLSINSECYPFLLRWHAAIAERPAVKRGMTVCPFSMKWGTKPWTHPDWSENT
jgi:GSH-dependent disulfide-bond oxidoreductase